jgi:hypothetical protein
MVIKVNRYEYLLLKTSYTTKVDIDLTKLETEITNTN